MLDKFHCGDRFRLKSKPHGLLDDEDKVATFGRFLEMQDRHMPLLLVSAENATNRPMIDYGETADVLAGLAHVMVAQNANVSKRLSHYLPFNLNCFNGFIRLYWPGFSDKDPSRHHPYWDRKDLTLACTRHKRQPAQMVLEKILEAALFHDVAGVLRLADIEDMIHEKRMSTAREDLLEAGKELEYIELMEEELSTLQADKKHLNKSLSEAEAALANSKAHVSWLTHALEGNTAEAEASQAVRDPQTVDEALALANQECKHLAFAFNNKSEEKAYPFEKPEDVFWAMDWLNTVYFDSKSGRESCPDLNASIRDTLKGWTFSPNQSDLTIKKNREWYECTWDGQKYTIDEHLRYGTSTRPEHCIRIAFAWDPGKQRIVIGYLGPHQKNTKS